MCKVTGINKRVWYCAAVKSNLVLRYGLQWNEAEEAVDSYGLEKAKGDEGSKGRRGKVLWKKTLLKR